MKSISDRVDHYLLQERMISNMLDTPIALAQAVAATVFYAGYAELKAHVDASPVPKITADTELNDSEWALIRPLFVLYMERETALHLESTVGLGPSTFGRSSSEIGQEITQYEMDLPKKAFLQHVVTV
ncbi:hypothetical protein SAMN05216326_12723 [Nitrosomonas marina]|uniref:Uncharacterized protein n=1 Tax=Nitrosomonas marina TaxID=917 RepID=A0A1I0EH37_9PROT|nr:hypothetical protein [Nitrosomonas marina]SET44219.1 hypothetical protein SAMN05216326_12723 [Nitrosomonas marina]